MISVRTGYLLTNITPTKFKFIRESQGLYTVYSTLPKRAVRNVLFRIFTKNVTLEFLLYKKDKNQIFAFCENPNKMF